MQNMETLFLFIVAKSNVSKWQLFVANIQFINVFVTREENKQQKNVLEMNKKGN